jgi:hypothetical protein
MLVIGLFLQIKPHLRCVPTFIRWSEILGGKTGLGVMLVVAGIWGFWPLLTPEELNPSSQYGARFLNVLVPVALLPAALIAAYRPDWLQRQRICLVRLSAIFLLAQSLWQVGITWQWHDYLGTVRSLLASHAGAFRLRDTSLDGTMTGHRAACFDWTWANPSLSIALAPQGKVRSLLLSPVPPLWEPFNPTNINNLPKLAHYGIDYSSYQSALANSNVITIRLRGN